MGGINRYSLKDLLGSLKPIQINVTFNCNLCHANIFNEQVPVEYAKNLCITFSFRKVLGQSKEICL